MYLNKQGELEVRLTVIWLRPASLTVKVDEVKYRNAKSMLSLGFSNKINMVNKNNTNIDQANYSTHS